MARSMRIAGRTAVAGLARPRVLAVVPDFESAFVTLFNAHFPRLFRYLDRLSGDPELAADVAQEAFVRLHERGSCPDAPAAWLITVSLNLLRNALATQGRRRRLLTPARMAHACADPPPAPDEVVTAHEARGQVRAALARMPERERQLLLLRAEGYSYRDMAQALHLNEASVGVMLARAKQAFRTSCEEASHAPR